MLNRSASLAMSTSVLKTLPGKLDIKRHSPSILYLLYGSYMREHNHKLYYIFLILYGYSQGHFQWNIHRVTFKKWSYSYLTEIHWDTLIKQRT